SSRRVLPVLPMLRRPPSRTPFPSTPLFRSKDSYESLSGSAEPNADEGRSGEPEKPDEVREVFEYWRTKTRRPRASLTADRRTKRSEEHTSELQSRENPVCRLLPDKKK